MAIRKRGKHWLVVVEAGRDPATGKRKRLFATCASKQEAEREEARLKHQVATGLDLEPTRLTVGQYLDRWLQTKREGLAPSTYLRYREIAHGHITPAIGGIPLSRLRPLHVERSTRPCRPRAFRRRR